MSTPPLSRLSPTDRRLSLDFVLNRPEDAPRSSPFPYDESSPPYSPITPHKHRHSLPIRAASSSPLASSFAMPSDSSSPLSSAPESPALDAYPSRPRKIPSPAPSDASSALTELSRSPSPCPGLLARCSGLPSPPASQPEHIGTPRSLDDSTCSSSTELDGRPKKRQRTSGMPRETRKLDLGELDLNTDSDNRQVMEKLVKGLRKYKKIVVIAGAGISVSAGIPDFRSKNGIFKSLKSEHKLKGSGKDLFDASVYGDGGSTETFHKMVRNMSNMVKSARPTPFHDLCARLAHEGRLLRMYTQNVDGLETTLEPLGRPSESLPLKKKGPWPKTIQLHGCLDKVVCTKCNQISDFDADMFDSAAPPICEECEKTDEIRTQHAGKRSHGVGRLRPRMVLYNEHNPDDEAIGQCTLADVRARPDCVLVVGTSMKIPGVRRMVREMCNTVRARRDGMTVWINCEPEPLGKDYENSWDIIVRGTSDEVARRAGLGKWDDPEILIEPTSDEDRKLATGSQPRVLLGPLQSSPTPLTCLPTPRDSPQFAGAANEPIADSKAPVSFADVLGKGVEKKSAAKKAPRKVADPAKGPKGKRAPKAPTKTQKTQSIAASMTVSKVSVAVLGQDKIGAKSSPSCTPQKRPLEAGSEPVAVELETLVSDAARHVQTSA